MALLVRSRTFLGNLTQRSACAFSSRHGARSPRTWRDRLTDRTTLTFFFFGSTFVFCNLYFLSDRGKRRNHDALTFRSYKLVAKESLSSSLSIFTFRPRLSPSEADVASTFNALAITSLEIKQPLLQISRAYTPLPARSLHEAELGDVRFLIRQEPHGEVSGYLHRLPVDAPARGSAAEIRGPFTEFMIPEDTSGILFLAGGTGIAPALQIAAAIANTTAKRISLHIMWANRRREDQKDGGIVQEFRNLQRLNDQADRKELRVDRFVDEDGSFITKADVQSFIGRHEHANQAATGKKLILISGPDGFVKSLAGSLRAPGTLAAAEKPVGGLLSTMDLQGWEVVKL